MNSGLKHVLKLVVKNSLQDFLLFSTVFRTNSEVSNPTAPFWGVFFSYTQYLASSFILKPFPHLQDLQSCASNSKPGFRVQGKQISLRKELQSLLKSSDSHYVSDLGKFISPYHKPNNTIKKKKIFFFLQYLRISSVMYLVYNPKYF